MTDTEKFIRVKSGAVYRWTPLMAKRRDAILVGPQEMADWHRSIGTESEYTKKYPERGGIPTPDKRKKAPPRTLKKAASRSKPQTMVSSEEEPDALKEIIGDGANLLTGN